MLDARRMEVYCAIYDSQLQPIVSTRAEIVNDYSFEEQLAVKPILFFGDGAAKCKPQLGGKPNAHFVDRMIYPTAKSVGMLAINAFTAGQFENIAYFEPFYLKDFVSRVV
jgi:tRNA threonylcarbamoyladenosine biosynthesis protein TsaB